MLILSQLARAPSAILSTTVLADVLHLPVTTVSKIMKILADAGMVTSARGSVGGYRLNRPAESITVLDIIRAMEGQVAMTECCTPSKLCSIDNICAIRDNWRKINHKIELLLASYTILDMADPAFDVHAKREVVSE